MKPITPRNYIIMGACLMSLLPLTACETLFGAKGVSHYPTRTASIEQRRDEEVFTTQYEILFESGLKMNAESTQTLAYLADIIEKSKPTLTRITGHTDSFGDAGYNQRLSLKRAKMVARKLHKDHGIETRDFLITGVGEADPAVPTVDGAKLLENRRVVVELKK
ncbi:MAG TPA: OmpA family protein [Micavibrio sp.]